MNAFIGGLVDKFLGKSWKTSLFGWLTGISLFCTQASALFDNDPNTAPEWGILGAAVASIFAGLSGRDNNKSSEDVGTK